VTTAWPSQREQLAKIVAMFDSDVAGERVSAFEHARKIIGLTGRTWLWVSDLIRKGEAPDDEREKLLARLVIDRLGLAEACQWAMSPEERICVEELRERCKAALSGGVRLGETTTWSAIMRTIEFTDAVRKRARS
jgi:hypothetical protein